jgi:hypothetical protein
MVLTWMMMPRAGGRDFKDTRKIIARVFERNLQAWDEDNSTFSGPPPKAKTAATKKKAMKKPAKKSTKKKKTAAKKKK